MNCTVHEVAKIWTRLSNFHFHNKLMNRTKKEADTQIQRTSKQLPVGTGKAQYEGGVY